MSDTGKKYIPSGVFLKCNQGSIPGQLTVLPTQVTLYGEPWATDLDAQPMVNVMPFGICQVLSKSNPVPCVPATIMWLKALEGGLEVNGAKPLLETSELPCSVGGTIKIFFTREAAMASISADEAHKHAAKAKEASLWLFGAAVLAAVVVVGLTVATGGAALPLLAAAGAAAATGAAIGGGVGAVAGGIDGYAHGGAEGAAIGAAKGLFVGGIMGALGGASLAVGGPVAAGAMGLSALAFGTGAAFDTKALLDEPNLENGLVVVADVVVLAGGLVGERFVKSPEGEPNESKLSLEEQIQKSQEAYDKAKSEYDALPNKYKKKTVATDDIKTLSGWGEKPDGFADIPPENVKAKADEIGHTPAKAGAMDQKSTNGFDGKYNCSHSEKQIWTEKPNEPIGSSREVCTDCQGFGSKQAVSTGNPNVVTGPEGTYVFNPDGTTDFIPK